MSDPHADLLIVQIRYPPSDHVFQFCSNVRSSSDSSTSATQRNVWLREVLALVTVPQLHALSQHTQRRLMPQGLESGECEFCKTMHSKGDPVSQGAAYISSAGLDATMPVSRGCLYLARGLRTAHCIDCSVYMSCGDVRGHLQCV